MYEQTVDIDPAIKFNFDIAPNIGLSHLFYHFLSSPIIFWKICVKSPTLTYEKEEILEH